MPQNSTVAFVLGLILCVSLVSGAYSEPTHWTRSLEAGQELAQEQEKNLLVVFTGHGWCQNCEILDREVFQQGTFVKETEDSFILVELDFTFGESPKEEQRKTRLQKLAKHFLIAGYPTTVLMDKQLRPFAYLVGYDEDIGVQRYITRISNAYEDYLQFKKSLKSSTSTSDYVALANSIAELAEHFDVDDNRDDPVVTFYSDEVDTVLSNLPETSETRKKIALRQKNQTLRATREATWKPISEKLATFYVSKDWEAAFAYVDATSSTLEDPSLRLRLKLRGLNFLSNGEHYKEALALVRQVLELTDLDFEHRRRLENQQSRILLKLGEVDEAITRFDERIAAAEQAGGEGATSWLLFWKVQLMLSTDRLDETIAVCRASRKAASHGSDHWQTATFLLALKLRSSRQFEEAIRLSTELFEVEPNGVVMLDIAEAQLGLGMSADATKWIKKAAGEAARLRESARKSDRDSAEIISQRTATLKND